MYITPDKYSYEETREAFKEAIKGKESVFSDVFDITRFENEAKSVNLLESLIPEELRFELELNLILEKKLTQYNKDLYSGKKNSLFENVQNLSEQDKVKLKEALVKLEIAINEANLSGGLLADRPKISTEDSAPTTGSTEETSTETSDSEVDDKDKEENKGILSTLSSIGSALTEGGSAIGIFHLLLDVIGLIGGPGIGTAADAINGAIYIFREKYILGIISLIAALIPFGGQFIKIFKGEAKLLGSAEKVLFQGAEASTVLAGKSAKEADMLTRFFDFLKGTATKALTLAISALKSILVFLGKFLSWIPYLGPKIEKFIGEIVVKMDKFSTELTAKLDKAVASTAKAIDEVIIRDIEKVGKVMEEGGKVSTIKKMVPSKEVGKMVEVEMLVVTPKNKVGFGQVTDDVIEIPISKLKELNYWNRTFPAGFEEAIIKKYGIKDTAKFYETITAKYYKTAEEVAVATKENLIGKVIKIGGKTLKIGVATTAFFGKQIFKLLTSSHPFIDGKAFIDGKGVNKKLHGDAAIWSLMDKRMKKELEENPGQIYSVPKIDDVLKDKEMFDAILDQQNTYAKKFGQPSIIPVAYYVAKNSGEEVPEEVNDFMNTAYSDSERADMQKKINIVDNTNKKEKSSPKNESYQFKFKPTKFKYLTPYNKF